MPVFRWSSPLFSLAVAVVLASVVVPARAQVAFGYGQLAAWSTGAALPCYGFSYAVLFPGYARIGGWSVAGWPLATGLHGAAGRLTPR
jgi:hypothetical protein